MNTLNFTSELIELISKTIALIIILGSGAWAVNKLWLSSIYQTKKDSDTGFQKLQREIHMQNEKLNIYEKENEVFKATYKGDMDLIKMQNQVQTDMMKDIAHKVNNIASIRVKDIVEQIIEDKFKTR